MEKHQENSLFVNLSGFSVLVYVAGFMTWNFYLGHFGFFESDLLQTRFISAGILALVFPLFLFLVVMSLKKWFLSLPLLIKVFLFLIWIYFFSIFIFPQVSQSFGGGRPYLASLIFSAEAASNFKVFGILTKDIPNGEIAIESERGCKIYENKDIVIIGFISEVALATTSGEALALIRPNRVMIFNRENFSALSILPQNSNGLSVSNEKGDMGFLSQYQMGCISVRSRYGIVEPYIWINNLL